MSTPLTPGMSALLYVPEDSMDYHEYFPTQPDTSNYNDNTSFQLNNFSFDNNHQNLGMTSGSLQSLVPDQFSPGNQHIVSAHTNNPITETGASPFTDFLTSSMFQRPANTTPSPFQNHNTLRSTILLSENNEYANPVLAQSGLSRYNVSSDVVFVPTSNRHTNEAKRSQQHTLPSNHSSDYINSDVHDPVYVPSQQGFHYDVFGNVISPLRAMNEQYELQLDQNAYAGAGLDPAFLVPAPPLPDNVQQTFRQPSKLPSTQSSQNLVPPPPEPPAPHAKPGDPPIKVKRRRRRKPPPPPEVAAAKHKAFLQRNREAASKCRTKKKAQINELEDEERMGRQINAVLKDEFKDILGEVLLLREQVKEMPCSEDCDGCGEHAPMRKDSILATSSVGTQSIQNEVEEHSEDDDDEHGESGPASLQSVLSVDSPLHSFSLGYENTGGDTQVDDDTNQAWSKRKRDEPDAEMRQNGYKAEEGLQSPGRRQNSAYLEGYHRRQT